jgi:GTPase SAR1 family protein
VKSEVVIIGSSGAGKSSFLNRVTKNEFKYNTMFTTGVDFAIKTFNIDSKVIKGLFVLVSISKLRLSVSSNLGYSWARAISRCHSDLLSVLSSILHS